MRLIERILQSVERAPDAPAFIADDRPTSYRGLLALLSVTVQGLRAQGVRPGDPVALTLGQSSLYLVTVLALGRLGALIIPASSLLRPGERATLFPKFEIRTVVGANADAAFPGCKLILLRSVVARGDESALDAGGYEPGGATPFRIALTSGTTGSPKGVLQTHDDFVRRLDRMDCDIAEPPRVLPPGLQITAALNLAMHALCKGGTVVFPRAYEMGPFLDALRRHKVTHVALPPANLAPMLRALPETGPAFPDIRHLRLLGNTPTPSFVEQARRKFSPATYLPYGIAEIGVVSMATPETLAREPTSCGPLAPGVRLEALDGEGRVLPPGVEGEIRVSIPGMPSGYHGPDAGDRTRFRDGWFHPGDRGFVSAQGLVFVRGRSDNIINIGGLKVAPEFVESVLQDFPAVREAAVFMADEGIAGARIAAAIVPSGRIDWDALDRFATAELDARAPIRYYLAESLPRNAMGKLLRDELKVTNPPALDRDRT